MKLNKIFIFMLLNIFCLLSLVNADTIYDPNSFINPSNINDGDLSTSANKNYISTISNTEVFLGLTFNETYVSNVTIKHGIYLYDQRMYVDYYLQKYDGTTWSNVEQIYDWNYVASSQDISNTETDIVEVNDRVQGLRVRYYAFNMQSTFDFNFYLYELEYESLIVTTDIQDYYNTENISINIDTNYFSTNVSYDMGFYLTKLLGFNNSVNNPITLIDDKITLSNTFDDGLVAYYTMDGNVNDYSGNGNDGTVSGTETYINNDVFDFDGSSYITIPRNSNNYDGFSYCSWLNHNSLVGEQRLYSEGSTFYLRKRNDNTAYDISVSGLSDTYYNTGWLPNINTSYFVCFIYDGFNKNFYVDNELKRSESATGSISITGDSYLGTYSSGISLFDGSVDDVRIYDRALSENEISNLYNESRKRLGLVLDLPLRDTQEDYAPLDNTITLNGDVQITEDGAEFDGDGDYIDIPDTILTVNNSVSFWLKTNELLSSGVFSEDINNYESSINIIFTDDRVSAEDTDNVFKAFGSGILNNYDWHLYTFVYDSNNNFIIYQDGINKGSTTYTGNFLLNYLGNGYSGYSNGKFNGTIKDVKIYDRALSESEIQDLYAQYNFKETSGTYSTMFDLSDYTTRTYCQIDGTTLDWGTSSNYELYVDGDRQYLNQWFYYNDDTSMNITFDLTDSNDYEKSFEINEVSVYCGAEPNYKMEYVLWDNSSSSGTLNLFNLTEGGHELNLYVNVSSIEQFNYSYSFINDYTNPSLTQIKAYQDGYKFYFYDFFDIDELYIDTCFYTTDGLTRACNIPEYYNSNGVKYVNVTLTDLAGNTFTQNNYNLTINASYSFLELNSYDLNLTDFCFNTSSCQFLDLNLNFSESNVSYTIPYNGETYWLRTYQNETEAENVTVYVNPYINFNIYDLENDIYITNYTLNGEIVETNYIKKTYDLGLGEKTFEFSKSGYPTQTFIYDINTTVDINKTFYTDVARILLYIRNQNDGSIINGINFSVEFAATVGFNTTTSTGLVNITNLLFQEEEYFVVITNENYQTETLTFDFSNREIIELNSYVIDNNATNLGVVFVKPIDNFGNPIQGALVKALQWDSSLSSYIEVSSTKTGSDGLGKLNILLNDKIYIFRATSEGITAELEPQIVDSTQNGDTFNIQLTGLAQEYSYLLENIIANARQVYNNVTNISTITFNYDSSIGAVDVCISQYRVLKGTESLIGENCITDTSGTYILDHYINNSYLTVIKAQIKVDGVPYTFNSFEFQPKGSFSDVMSGLGLSLFIVPLLFLLAISLAMFIENVYIGTFVLMIMGGLSLTLAPNILTKGIVAFLFFIGWVTINMGVKSR